MNYNHLRKFLKKQPPKQQQLEAFRKNGDNIRFIRDPDNEVQLEAVKQNGYSISYIRDLTPELLIAYLESDICPEELKMKLSDPGFDLEKLLEIKGP